jgi:hypothetical protein
MQGYYQLDNRQFRLRRQCISDNPASIFLSPFSLKAEAAGSSEMLVLIYPSTHCHIPESSNLDTNSRTSNLTFIIAV